MEPVMRGLIVHGGGAAHDELASHLETFHVVPLSSLAAFDLERYDVVVVPRSSDQDALLARRHQFARFLGRGGIVVAFGESPQAWLPGVDWSPESPDDVSGLPRVHPHPIVDGLSAEDLWWHRDAQWCCHGHLRAPAGAEPLVSNAAGLAWAYVDRVSTPGTMLLMANVDVDTHLFHGNATARQLMERILAWLEEEAARNAARRARPSEKLAYLVSGAPFQTRFVDTRPALVATLPAVELGSLDLNGYRGLWVPRESDQVALEAAADRIEAYVRGGGTLIAFEELRRPWLPGARWQRAKIDVAGLERADHPLARAVPELRRPWHAHGLLEVPPDSTVLLRDPASGLAALATWSFGAGRVLAGTLDPDSHAGYGSRLGDDLLAAIMAWIAEPVAAATVG